MKTLSEIQQFVNDKLTQLGLDTEPSGLYEPIAYELGVGGKRLRPSYAIFTSLLFGGDEQNVLYPALALEVFHNFTLMHDDIMDNADKRRNKPTVHRVWNVNTAILSGDAMLNKAYELLFKTTDEAHFRQLLDLFNHTAAEVFEGQQYDMNFEVRGDVSLDEYMKMIRLKTAVLLAASLKIGAICGGASEVAANAIYEFGINMGLSFQLRDDYLDVYGDVATFGKNIGGDICDNKKTYLLIRAIEKAKDTPDEAKLNRWLHQPNPDRQQKIQGVTEVYNELGIREETEAAIEEQFVAGSKVLEQAEMPDNIKQELLQLAGDLLERKF